MARAAWASVGAAACAVAIGLVVVACAPAPVPAQSLTYSGEPLQASSNWDMPPDLKIAIVGDVDLRARPESRNAGRDIYRLIRAEGAHALLCQGDLTYLALEGGLHDRRAIPQAWAQAMDQELGPDFPVFAVAGNHDVEFDQWYPPYGGHQKLIFDRLQRQGWAKYCRGEVGLNSLCVFKGLAIVQSGIGTVGDKAQDLKWIQTALADIDAAEPEPKADPNASASGSAKSQQSGAPHRHRLAWRVCSWHMVTGRYQTGSVPRSWYEDVGAEPYDVCRQHGAFIVTGHEHAYARTHGMANFARTAVAPRTHVRWTRAGTLSNASAPASGAGGGESGPHAPAAVDEITLSRGSSWAALVGVGTSDVRPVTSALDRNPWWGAASNAHNGGQPAVLFCTLNAGGDLSRGFCELKGIWHRSDPQMNRFGHAVADRFEMRNTLVTHSPLVPEARKREL